MTVLAVDIGNSRVKLGVFRGKKLISSSDVGSANLSSGRILSEIRRVLRESDTPPKDVSGSVISSVVPLATKRWSAIVKRHIRSNPLIVSGAIDVGVAIGYTNPAAAGADRICSAVAAFQKFGGPVIVIDAGTATTYSVVSKDGVFLGGAIAPGVMTAVSALQRRTAQLPRVRLCFPKSVIGTSTSENIQSGILYGTIGAMEGMVRRIKGITGRSTKVILTGGFSQLLKNNTRFIDAVAPLLVLEGARMIFEHVKRTSR